MPVGIVLGEGKALALDGVTDDRRRPLLVEGKAPECGAQLGDVMPVDFRGGEAERAPFVEERLEIQDLEPLLDKWRAFGFAATEVDGHDVAELRATFGRLPLDEKRPTAIVCHTIQGKGLPFAENDPNWHHKAKLAPAVIAAMYQALE